MSCSSWSDQTVGGRGSFLDLFVSVVAWSNDRASVYKAVEAVEVVLRRVVFFLDLFVSEASQETNP